MSGLTPVGPEPIPAEKCGAVQPKGGHMEGGILDHSRLLHTTEGDESRRIGLGSGIVDVPEVRSDLEQRRYPGASERTTSGGRIPVSGWKRAPSSHWDGASTPSARTSAAKTPSPAATAATTGGRRREPADERHVVGERARRQENVHVGLVGNLVVWHHRHDTHTKAARGANGTIGC